MRLPVLTVGIALWLAGCGTQAPPLATQETPRPSSTPTTDEGTAAGEVAPTSGWQQVSEAPLPEPYVPAETEKPGAGGEPDGRLDCAEDRFVDMFSDFGEGGGAPDPWTALHQAMDPKAELAGGEVIIRNESYATVVVDNREVATAESIELPDGTWAVNYVRACDESLLPID